MRTLHRDYGKQFRESRRHIGLGLGVLLAAILYSFFRIPGFWDDPTALGRSAPLLPTLILLAVAGWGLVRAARGLRLLLRLQQSSSQVAAFDADGLHVGAAGELSIPWTQIDEVNIVELDGPGNGEAIALSIRDEAALPHQYLDLKTPEIWVEGGDLIIDSRLLMGDVDDLAGAMETHVSSAQQT